MSLIHCAELSFEFAGNYILKGIDCSIEHNSRIGLIGVNGCGKTTLIRLLLGELNPSSGIVQRASRLQVAYLPQNARPDASLSVRDYARQARPDLLELRYRIEALSSQIGQTPGSDEEKDLHAAVERFTSLGGYEWDNQLKYVLLSLSFPEDTWHQAISSLSGGERTRLCLAAILLKPHDLLILDEPTNHLDIAMISWLERYLMQQDKPYLLVSHDRSFLDHTVRGIFHLEHGSLSITKGNYSSWKEADAIARLSAERQYERQQKHIAQTMDFVRKNIEGQKTKQAQSRLKQLERMDLAEKPLQPQDFKIRLQSSSRSGNDLFSFKDVSFSAGGKKLACGLNLLAEYQDRICIIGANGCGKTTLLRMLIGEHKPDEGILKTGASLKIGYYDQHHVNLDASLSVMDTLWKEIPEAPRGYILSWLARFGFRGDNVEKSIAILSGGEKSRLYLSVLIHSKPNLLIMDEPTNHLDLQMSDALLEALLDFDGSIIFVTHDRWFLSKLATRYWIFRKYLDRGQIFTTVEDAEMEASQAIDLSFSQPEIPKQKPAPRTRQKRINPRVLELKQAEINQRQDALQALKQDLHQIQQELSISETYSQPHRLKELHSAQAELEQQITSMNDAIDLLEHDYLELLCEQE